VSSLFLVKPVRRAGRPRRIRRRTRTRRATVRRPPRPPSAAVVVVAAAAAAGDDGADGAGGPPTVGTPVRRRRRQRRARDRPRPRDLRRTTGTAVRGARNRPATTVRARLAAVGGRTPLRRWTAATVAGGAATAVAAVWTGWSSRPRPRPSRWSSCPCWPCRPATRCAASGRCSATAATRRPHRRWPAATRTRTGGAAAPPTDGGGDGGGRGATAAGGAARRDSGRGGTAAGGAGSAAAAAVRTAPASPVRCRPAIRSTRCPCDWRPDGRRPRSNPCPSLYNLSTQNETII